MVLAELLQSFIDERIDHMLEAPEMWGADESVELQLLQLLELRVLVVGTARDAQAWRSVQVDYEHFLGQRLPDTPPMTLTARLGAERRSELFGLLGTFVGEQRKVHPAPSEAERNLGEVRVISDLLAKLVAEYERRDTYGSRAVRISDEGEAA